MDYKNCRNQARKACIAFRLTYATEEIARSQALFREGVGRVILRWVPRRVWQNAEDYGGILLELRIGEVSRHVAVSFNDVHNFKAIGRVAEKNNVVVKGAASNLQTYIWTALTHLEGKGREMVAIVTDLAVETLCHSYTLASRCYIYKNLQEVGLC